MDLQQTFTDLWFDIQPYLLPFAKSLAVLVFGTILAILIWRLTRFALGLLQVDRWVASLMPKEEGAPPTKLEEPLAKVVFIVAMLGVAAYVFHYLEVSFVTEALDKTLSQVADYGRKVVFAGIILVAGAVLAKFVRFLVVKSLEVTNIDRQLRKNLSKDETLSVSRPLGEVTYWAVMVIFLMALTSAEVSISLAMVVYLNRRKKTVDVRAFNELRG